MKNTEREKKNPTSTKKANKDEKHGLYQDDISLVTYLVKSGVVTYSVVLTLITIKVYQTLVLLFLEFSTRSAPHVTPVVSQLKETNMI